MGLFMRRRRPVARLAAGAATAGVAYHMGKRRSEQDMVNQQATAAYDATQQAPAPQDAPAPQYAPPPPAAAPAIGADQSGTAELEKLAELHGSGVLTDAEFTAAKAKLLGL